MSLSFGLLIDDREDFITFLDENEKHFDIKFCRYHSKGASAINHEKNFILDITPSKMLFLFENTNDPHTTNDFIDMVKQFMSRHLKGQTVGLKFYKNDTDNNQLSDVRDVRTILL